MTGYEVGQRIRLTETLDDPAPIAAGATGTINYVGQSTWPKLPKFAEHTVSGKPVDSAASGRQIGIDWDPPNERRSLMLIEGVDKFEVL